MNLVSWILLFISILTFFSISSTYRSIKISKKIKIELVNRHTTACMLFWFFSILFVLSLL